MNVREIISQRLTNQQLAQPKFKRASDLVEWMGAIQAQEFGMARWAIGLRVPTLDDAAIEQAFNHGDFLRTHVLRPTWHFVTPADIRWLLALSSPQVNAISAYMHRRVELDERIFRRSNAILTKALQGGRHLTRVDLQHELLRAKLSAEGQRLAYLMMRAELDGIICSGSRIGKQFTYALLEERVPASKPVDRNEALSRLSERYFRSRGPATMKDFSYWSGLKMSDARAGSESLPTGFEREKVAGNLYIFPTPSHGKSRALSTFLMPEYDEYGMGYKDRNIFQGPRYDQAAHSMAGPPRRYCFVVNGQLAGTWCRDEKNRTAIIETAQLDSFSRIQQRAIRDAVQRYNTFVRPTPK